MKFFQISLPDNHQLVLFGDNQEGNIASSHKDFDECIEYIMSTPNCYAAHMGDAVEAYWVDDPRYLPETCTHPPLKQAQFIIKKFLPLVKEGKLITMLMGNHEASLIRKAGDITEFICEELRNSTGSEWPYYGTYSAKVEVMSGKDLQYKFHITHGRRAINSVSPDPRRRRAYMKHTLQRHLEPIFGDVVLAGKGHTHRLIVAEPEPELYLISVKGKIKQQYTKPSAGKDLYIPPELRYYVNTGSFLRTYEEGVSTYSEIAEYPPVELGYILAEVNDRAMSSVKAIVL